MSMISNWLESLDYEYNILNTCVRHLSPKATCTKCMESCTEAAIYMNSGMPTIEKEKCTECGKCIVACPVEAIEGIFPKRVRSGNQLDLSEEKSTLSIEELLIYHAYGIDSILIHQDNYDENWENIINETNNILEKLEKSTITVEKIIEKKEKSVLSRRELFHFWHNEGKSMLQEVTPAKWRFNQSNMDVTKYYPTHQFFTIQIDVDSCTLCKTCEFVCPKNCFAITDESFVINSQRCYECKLCEDTCLESAISIRKIIKRNEEETYPIFNKNCSQCDRPYSTLRAEDTLCTVCIKRKTGYLSSKVC